MTRDVRGYAVALWVLLGLFTLRVAGQLSIALGAGGFLAPWEDWFSGALAYPALLTSQLLIMLLYGAIARDLTRGYGVFAVPRSRLGSALVAFGSLYLGVMVIRYSIRMTLYPAERWWGGSIPIVFHWVLASFILVFGVYHWRTAPPPPAWRYPKGARVTQGAAWLLIAVGIGAWITYQLAPTFLAPPSTPVPQSTQSASTAPSP